MAASRGRGTSLTRKLNGPQAKQVQFQSQEPGNVFNLDLLTFFFLYCIVNHGLFKAP